MNSLIDRDLRKQYPADPTKAQWDEYCERLLAEAERRLHEPNLR